MTRRTAVRQIDIQRAIRAARAENAARVVVQGETVVIELSGHNPPPISTGAGTSGVNAPRLKTADEALAEIDRWAR